MQSFGGTIWAFLCVDCARLLLKPTSGMADWRVWAQTCPSGSSPDLVARLPVVACNRGAAALGLHSTGTPLGLCDRCCARRKRAARRDLAPSLSATTLPPRSHTAGVPTPGVPLAPRLLPHLGQAPAPPSPCMPQDGWLGSALSFGTQSDSMGVSTSFPDGASSGIVDRLGGERQAAARAESLGQRRRAVSPTRVGEGAQPQELPVDARRRLLFASGGELSREPIQPPPSSATKLPALPSCREFLDCLRAGNYDRQQDNSTLEDIASAILWRGDRHEIRLRHKNGSVRVYQRQLSRRKAQVKTSPTDKRREAARRLQGGGAQVGVAKTKGCRTRPSRGAVQLSVTEQVGLVAAPSMSNVGFNHRRLALGGDASGLCSLLILRFERRELSALPGKKVDVTGSGAHLVSLTAAIQERVLALCDGGLFVERLAYASAALNDAATAATSVATAAVAFPGSPATSGQDVQIVVGLDKGGDPGTVKIVASNINQAHPNSPSNTILVGVCPCDNDKYEALAAMMETHLPQIDALLRDGVKVHGARRPVRLMFGCDYDAQCCFLGHKGATASQPCLMCKRTRSPSVKQALLDAIHGTLQDESGSGNLPEGTSSADRMVMDYATRTIAMPGTPDHHCSVARSPLLGIDPRQIVPIPRHTTQGINHRFLRLAVKTVMVYRSATDGAAAGRQAGADFVLELVGLLHERVRVRPTDFYGGLFIGRDCHTIDDNSALVRAAFVGKVSPEHPAAYEKAWSLWNRDRKTLNRPAIIPAWEVVASRADTSAMVTVMKGSLGWLSNSPKIHILMFHAPDFLELWGSIGLYREQGLEAWHGRYGQNAVKFPGATELERAAGFMRAMLLAREAGADVLARYMETRRSAAAGARKATKATDKRRRQNKPALPECTAKSAKAAKKRLKWAVDNTEEAAKTVGANLKRVGQQSV